MFCSSEHHAQLLGPEWYTSVEHHALEQDAVFRSSWQCVGAMSEFPRDGDFKTLTLFGYPIIIRRSHGKLTAFLNVCSHRFSQLTGKACGNMSTLKCQYHGWEFDDTGNTRRIPDATCFRPLEPGMLGLDRVRIETCGQLVFVAVSEDAPPLRDFLGDCYDRMAEWFHDGLFLVSASSRMIRANWKIPLENNLESYHVVECHQQTMGSMPRPEQCRHELHDNWCGLEVEYEGQRSMAALLDDVAHYWIGEKPSHRWEQFNVFPNILCIRVSLAVWIESMIPISPDTSLSIGVSFGWAGTAGLRSRISQFLTRRWLIGWYERLIAEDLAPIESTQLGMASPKHPRGGLISTREERIFHFQRYLLNATGQTTPAANEVSDQISPAA